MQQISLSTLLAAPLLLFPVNLASAQSCDEWVAYPVAAAPSPRMLQGMCYDSVRQVTVLFGGTPGCLSLSEPVGETWEYDGFGWVQKMAAGPSPRAGHGMAFDSARGVSVLFGGQIHQGFGSAVYSGETWEWDGSTWALRSTTGPSPRVAFGMTYDRARGVVVLFGGETDQYVQSAETWEWDGNAWTLVSASGPSARSNCATVYDPLRAKCLLYGGSSLGRPGYIPQTDLWEWDGVNWSLVHSSGPILYSGSAAFDIRRKRLVAYAPDPGLRAVWEWDGTQWIGPLTDDTGPQAVYPEEMVYDEARAVSVLFGGDHDGDCSTVSDETWEWNGATWRQQGRMVPSRSGHGMAYDSGRKRLVVCGGVGSFLWQSGDTWLWNGNGWREVFPASLPAARSMAVMDYDEERQVTVLFGGTNGGSISYNETWEFDGSEWHKRQVAGPPGGQGWAMVYDSARKLMVLFGGGSRLGGDDTWEYDGQAWVQRADTGPPARTGHALAYDPIRGRTVLFGGLTAPSDTWEWDGQTWEQIDVPGPPARGYHAMLFDPVRREVVLMGGYRSTTVYGDVWGFDGISWVRQMDLPTPRQLAQAAHYPGRNTTVIVGGSPSSTMLEREPDSDNDGVIDSCDTCPGTLRRAPVDAAGCLLPIPGDFDRDGDVDEIDLDHWAGCATGPAIPVSQECGSADLDSDQDVDQTDFGLFQRCMSGEHIAGTLNCAL